MASVRYDRNLCDRRGKLLKFNSKILSSKQGVTRHLFQKNKEGHLGVEVRIVNKISDS